MKSLLIHNSKIPDVTVKQFETNLVFVPSREEVASTSFDYDLFCHRELSNVFSKAEYNIIYVSLNLSDYDYRELGGLRVAHHIRLTREWNHMFVPIVILAQEDYYQIMKLSKLGEILFTSGIYLSKDLRFDREIKSGLNAENYVEKYLTKIEIQPPANYQSHHSIANEWALARYFSMLPKGDTNEKYKELSEKISELSYFKSLHFKYSEAKVERQQFKKEKHYYLPNLNNINGKRISVIDDEVSKGWGIFYEYILGKSGANKATHFNEFKNGETRDNLVKNIKNWINQNYESNEPVDIYIIDLRLHEDDFNENHFDNLSGIQLINFIKNELNSGIQIVVSTASNKVWNIQKCMEYGTPFFATKESPETFNNREGTKLSLMHLGKEISKASDRTYLAEIYREIKELQNDNCFSWKLTAEEIEFKRLLFDDKGLLKELYSLLEIGESQLINSALLICFSILENYSELYGTFESTWSIYDRKLIEVLRYNSSNALTSFELKKGYFEDIMQNCNDENKTLIGLDFYSAPQQRSNDPKRKATKASPIIKISLVLKYRDNLPDNIINRLIKLRYIRNNMTAHAGNIKPGVRINVNDVKFLIQEIFMKIFK